jgi:hypothetical protein
MEGEMRERRRERKKVRRVGKAIVVERERERKG